MVLVLTRPPENRVVEEGELHLGVMLQRRPAPRRRHVDVGHVERDLHCQEGLRRVPDLKPTTSFNSNVSKVLIKTAEGPAHLKVRSDGAAADVDELSHVVEGVEGPDAALQVQVFVELDGFSLADVGVELVGPVITRPE